MDSRDVIALVREISDGLGPDVVRVRRQVPAPGVLALELVPANPESAVVGIRIAEAGETDAVVSLGDVAIEIPAEGAGYSGGSGLDDIRALITTALAGDFLERVWYRGSRELRREGVCHVGDREVTFTHVSPLWFVRRRGQVRETRFAPYR